MNDEENINKISLKKTRGKKKDKKIEKDVKKSKTSFFYEWNP